MNELLKIVEQGYNIGISREHMPGGVILTVTKRDKYASVTFTLEEICRINNDELLINAVLYCVERIKDSED